MTRLPPDPACWQFIDNKEPLTATYAIDGDTEPLADDEDDEDDPA